MRIFTALAVGAGALCLASASVHAQAAGQTPGWYIGGEAGWSHLEDLNASGSQPGIATSGKVKTDEGYAVGGNGGYAFRNGLRLEGEIVYRDHNLKNGRFGSAFNGPVQGDISTLGFMANAIYDFMPNNVWTPYIGAGIGGARLSLNDAATSPNIFGGTLSDDTFQLAYQAIGGVKYAIDTNWSASLDYRYFSTTDASFHGNLSGTPTTFKTDYHSHNVMLGVAYHFAPPPPPPPPATAPVPVAAPAAPPPSQARTFLVFFDFNKSTLTPEGAQVVQQAAATYKSTGSAKLDVTGYTDLSGTARYNMGLSKRRADTVRTALVRDGVPDSAIVEAWHGKENPRVPTPDGVREPQNRRVEIMLP